MHDFLVVGAGPAGLFASIELSSRNMDVLVFEEDKKIGIPRHCTGVISSEAAKLIGNAASSSLLKKIKTAYFIYDNNKRIKISFPEEVTNVLERVRFEEILFDEANKRGAEIFLGEKVKKVNIFKDKVSVVTTKGEFEARALIYAAGSKPSILDFLKNPSSIPAIQYEMEGDPINESAVEIIFCEYAKGFFVWKVPTSNHSFLIGLANSRISPKKALDKFIYRKGIKGNVRAIYSGRIITGGAISRNVFNNIAIIGDSAGHVKPTTGGGLFFGILGAKIVGSLFPYYLETKDYSILRKMEKLIDDWIKKRIIRMKKFSDFFFSLEDKRRNLILDAIASTNAVNKLKGEIQDFHENVITLLIKDLSLNYNALIRLLRSLLYFK